MNAMPESHICQLRSVPSVAAWRGEIERRIYSNPIYYNNLLWKRDLLRRFDPDADPFEVLREYHKGTWPALRAAATLVGVPRSPAEFATMGVFTTDWEPPRALTSAQITKWLHTAEECGEPIQDFETWAAGRLAPYLADNAVANDNGGATEHQAMPLPPATDGAPLPEDIWGCTVLVRSKWQRIEVTNGGMALVTEQTEKGKTTFTRAPITYSPVSIYGMTTPADSDGGAGILVKLRNDDGRERILPLPAEYVFENGNALVKWLRRHGVRAERKRIDELLNYFAAASSPKRVISYNKPGWHNDPDGNRVFVMGDTVIGAKTESVFLPADPTAISRVLSVGSLADWRENVATRACGVLGWRFSLCVAFVAPILYLLDETSVFFHIAGRTTTGKTLAQRIAASAWGKGTKSDSDAFLRTWNNTGNAVEGEAAAYCDLLLALDELGEADGGMVGNVVYMLSDGAGRGRMKSDATMRTRRRWRIAVLSSGEVSIESKIKESGKRVAGGMGVRALELDGGRLLTRFDGAKALETATTRAYGTAGPAFISQLIQHGYAVPGHPDNIRLRSRVDSIVTEFSKGLDDTRVSRAARSFAMVAAAGELAVSFGIAPATLEPLETARAAFKVWCEGNGAATTDDALMAAKRLVALIEAELGVSIVSADDDHGSNKRTALRPRQGWFRDDDVWLLPATVEGLLQGYAVKEFLAAAAEHGFKRAEGRNLQTKVPGSDTRAYRFSLAALRNWADPESEAESQAAIPTNSDNQTGLSERITH